jgi:dimethylargininase
LIALTRSVPPSIVSCELTHLARTPIDVTRAAEQHDLYEKALVAAGCSVQRLPSLPELADSVFVEDTAVVLPELAIIARPGAASRRLEVRSVVNALRPLRALRFIEPPGTLDGGDVLPIGSTIYVGESTRTNEDGIRQLTEIASLCGSVVRPVKVSGFLHLKSAVTRISEDAVLLNPAWIDASLFRGMHRIDVHPDEPFAANALWTGEVVIFETAFDKTLVRLQEEGIDVIPVEMDELQKAEGAVTCCSILISTSTSRRSATRSNFS